MDDAVDKNATLDPGDNNEHEQPLLLSSRNSEGPPLEIEIKLRRVSIQSSPLTCYIISLLILASSSKSVHLSLAEIIAANDADRKGKWTHCYYRRAIIGPGIRQSPHLKPCSVALL